MPINSTHPDYDANALAWSRARDVLASEDAVKAAGARYLPLLDCQTEKDYGVLKHKHNAVIRALRRLQPFPLAPPPPAAGSLP